MERVSTVSYYAIKQSLIGFITERVESSCSVCAVTMPNCSAIKASRRFLSAALMNPHQAGEAYVTLAHAVDWNTACRAGGGSIHNFLSLNTLLLTVCCILISCNQ